MPDPLEWWEKSQFALKLARRALEDHNPPGAANRLWYAIYAGVHAVLVRRGMTPRQALGNWAHEDVIELYKLEVYPNMRTQQARSSLGRARGVIEAALTWRIAADYGDHRSLDEDELRRAVAQISRVLQYIKEECL